MPADFNQFLFNNRSAVLILLDGFICGVLIAVAGYPISLGSSSFFTFFLKLTNEKLRTHIHILSLIAILIMGILGFKVITKNIVFIGIVFFIITSTSVTGNILKNKYPIIMQNISIFIWGIMILLAILNIFLKIELHSTQFYALAGICGILCGSIGIPPAPLFALIFTGQINSLPIAVMTLVILSLPATVVKLIKDIDLKKLDYRIIFYFTIGLFLGIVGIVKIAERFIYIIPIVIITASLLLILINIKHTIKTYRIIRGNKLD